MILLIDIGNSRIKWTTSESGHCAPGRAASWSAQGIDALFESLWSTLPAIESAWVANVAGPDIEQRLDRVVRNRFGIEPHHVRSATELGGIRNRYREPARLGVDRLVAMVAAYRRYRAAVCVVDCGTAVTVDLVDAGGVFRGGVIAPGSTLMREALARGTHALLVTDSSAFAACARSTEEGIASGSILAVSGLIARVQGEFARELGEPPRCILTGGESPAVLPAMTIPCDHDADLVLKGLAHLAANDT